MIFSKKQTYFITCFVIVFYSLFIVVLAHKDSAQSATTTNEYNFALGLNPANPYQNNMQDVYLMVTDIQNNKPASQLHVEVAVAKTFTDATTGVKSKTPLQTYTAAETGQGHYIATHSFEEKGTHEITLTVHKGESTLTTINKEIYIEPERPSTFFWMYMFLALITAIYIALRSDTLA